MNQFTWVIIKASHREVVSATLKAQLLWFHPELLFNNIISEIPYRFGLVIKTQRENCRFIDKYHRYQRVWYRINWYNSFFEANHLTDIQFLEYVHLVEYRYLENFILNERNRKSVARFILRDISCLDIVTLQGQGALDFKGISAIHYDRELLLRISHNCNHTGRIIWKDARDQVLRGFNNIFLNQILHNILVWSKPLDDERILIIQSQVVVFYIGLLYNTLPIPARKQPSLTQHIFLLLPVLAVVVIDDAIVLGAIFRAILLQRLVKQRVGVVIVQVKIVIAYVRLSTDGVPKLVII